MPFPSPFRRPLHTAFRRPSRFARRADAVGAAIALLACAAATPLAAQQSTTRGWSLGAQLLGSSLTVEDADAQSGGGLALRAGYGFNRRFTVFAQVDASQIDIRSGDVITGAWELSHAELGARFHFANSLRRWVPYLEAAAGVRGVRVTDAAADGERVEDLSFSGGTLSVGGGVSIHFNRSWAFDTSLRFAGGQFSEISVGDVTVRRFDLDATSVRFGIGVVWWP
jgi:hypothetical protein